MIPNISGALSGIINQLPLPGRMTIIPLKKISPIPIPVGPPYVAQFNPETYSTKYEADYHKAQGDGDTAKELKFSGIKPRTFNFEFLIDGTGASGEKREVEAEVQLFKRAIEFRGDEHRPAFLLLIWGNFIVAAVLETLDIKYTLFRANGTPLRAILSTSFKEHTPKELEILRKVLLSPDLTTRRMVDTGEKLPLMTHRVYDNGRHYLEVARANQLTNFRNVEPGVFLDFPPLKKQSDV